MSAPKPTIPAESAFVITVGVPLGKANGPMCRRALRVLQQAGYAAGPTSDEAILALATQVQLTQQLEENDDADEDA